MISSPSTTALNGLGRQGGNIVIETGTQEDGSVPHEESGQLMLKTGNGGKAGNVLMQAGKSRFGDLALQGASVNIKGGDNTAAAGGDTNISGGDSLTQNPNHSVAGNGM